MTYNYILVDGQPEVCNDTIKWALWFEKNTEERIVAQDTIGDVRISTVFLGIDHNFDLSGPPILWETMIFGGEHDEYQRRYPTRDDAIAGHSEALLLVSHAAQGGGR